MDWWPLAVWLGLHLAIALVGWAMYRRQKD